MRFHNPSASVFVPDERPAKDALRKVTHLGIGAHPDDLEFMAMHGILEHFRDPTHHFFGGVVVCDGATGTDASTREKRRKEQEKASLIGQYAAAVMLDYPSAVARQTSPEIATDLAAILAHARPLVVYTHNPADKHPTHAAVCRHVIGALRGLPPDHRPRKVYGCEMWRGLDWLPDVDKVRLDVSDFPDVTAKLVRVFESQVAGGKRYDLAVPDRWQANATFDDPQAPDCHQHMILAMDLTPLLEGPASDVPDLADFVGQVIDRFKAAVLSNRP
ncbi:MAG: PIG-L family deacetylase [bacterium]